ncbi:hypothetical protein NLG97_g9372 [Lecanicillium saksenae]|uniref:Uncharacterized protein n=1 Tax=Lecanicillium saksenae TaxID=468837 RepID=A0ACC1QHI3_9HYPO|nr:hypothetical protein NLG97_g9372 [Lecanicillium saksenae]
MGTISPMEKMNLRKAVEASLQSAPPGGVPESDTSGHHEIMEPVSRHRDDNPYVDLMRLPPYQRTQMMGGSEFKEVHRAEMYRIQFPHVDLDQGDTLVFIDYPEPTKGKPPADCDGVPFRSQHVRMHSERLLSTGSSKFSDMLNPTYQFRIQRRLKMVNKLPEGVKYVLDLTPPAEGDEMVFQITELSLTPGIIKWWSSYARLDVPFFLVKGHDDVCSCKHPVNGSSPPAQTDSGHIPEAGSQNQSQSSPLELPFSADGLESLRGAGKKLQIEEVPPHFDIPDYCPIRHRNGIIRLLMLIEGKGIFIDSAPRLWTLVALAKIWDCVSVVQDQALQWLLQGSNSKLIELLPEEAIRMGGILENAQVTRTAFRILVNELAFEQTATDKIKQAIDFNHVTMFGRRKGDPGDEFSNLIQHAALTFVERATKCRAELESDDVFETWGLPEYKKLLKIEQVLSRQNLKLCEPVLNMISDLKKKLKSILNPDILNLRNRLYVPAAWDMTQVDSDRAAYVEPSDFQKFAEIYRMMTPTQRLLTRFPYKHLHESWTQWTEYSICDDSRVSPAAYFKRLGAEMTRFSLAYKDRIPWDSDINQELSDILSDSWEMPYGPLYALRHSRIVSQVQRKIESLRARVWDKNQDLHLMTTTPFVLNLTEDELKFLPLWAGGLNDGTGGVFEDQLPPADMGPNGPGPAYHTGMTIPSDASSLSGSFVDDMSAMNMAGSTTAASVAVHDSMSTIYRPDQVIVDDKSIASESFKSDFSDFHEARDKIDASGQKKEDVEESLDDFLQICDDESDSDDTIGCDDFDTLDEDDDFYISV